MSMPSPPRPLASLLALAVLAAAVGLLEDGARAAGDPIAVPDDLTGPTAELRAGLAELADAEDAKRARDVHDQRVRPAWEQLAPYAEDLAGREGRLLSTYLDELAGQLAAGNLSDARSLAGAGANLVREDVQPVVDRWSANRTAIAAGPVTWSDGRPVVSLVLVNPPLSGVAAFDASLQVVGAEPVEARTLEGRGEATVEPANGTARWAGFDAASLARLSSRGTDRVAIGELVLASDAGEGSAIDTSARVDELVDPEGRPVPAVGLSGEREVPAGGGGGFLDESWLAFAGVGVAAIGLGAWVRRWEV